MMINNKKYLAEALGTFFLVFAGTGSIIINHLTQGSVTQVGIGLTFGLVVLVLIYAIGPISGAHFNPAVTIAFVISRYFPKSEALAYIISQLLGAITASLVLLLLFGNISHLGATVPIGSEGQSLVLEFLLTFLLMFVIMSVSTGSKEVGQMAGLAVGLTVGLEAIFAGPISGASMNPARSFGPALIGLYFPHHWVYWVGPILGATLGALAYKSLRIIETIDDSGRNNS
jgi:MIP family channel proteins